MSIIEWKEVETVGIITMNNGENRHHPDFVRTMLETLDDIENRPQISAVIISSSDPKNWSLGIDLQWIASAMGGQKFQEIKEFLYSLNRLYTRLLLYPMPVISAINGHAFGGGAIMACACDFRFMKSDRGYFCFPEIDISIPFLPGMVAIVKKAVPRYKLEELVMTGRKTGADELETHHIIMRACENEATLMQESLKFANAFRKKRVIFTEMKKRLHGRIIEVMEKDDPGYIESLRLMV